MIKQQTSIWQRLLSYLTEVHLESLNSAENKQLSVYLKRGRLMLTSNNAIYSFDDLYTNFAVAFKRMKWSNPEVANVLVLGMGLGSIPYILEKRKRLPAYYTMVELDEQVIDLASRYSLHRLSSSFSLHAADALHFMDYQQDSYDLICMDVFVDDLIPESMEQVDFITQLRDSLEPGGLLLYNRLYQYTRDKIATEAFETSFSMIFPNFGFIEVAGNRVYFSDKSRIE